MDGGRWATGGRPLSSAALLSAAQGRQPAIQRPTHRGTDSGACTWHTAKGGRTAGRRMGGPAERRHKKREKNKGKILRRSVNVGQLDPSHTPTFFLSPLLSFLVACVAIAFVCCSTRTEVNSHRKRKRKRQREQTNGAGKWECRRRRGLRADEPCSQSARKLRSPCARCPLLAPLTAACLCLCFRRPTALQSHPHRPLFDSPSLRSPVAFI